MAHLELDRIVQRYGAHTVVDGVGFRVDTGGIACLLGPSGCGKTTLLRCIAGFEPIVEGEIRLDGAPVSRPGFSLPPEKRRIGMVFQDYALFPHLTVAGNIGFGLAALSGRERRARVEELLATVGLSGQERKYPHELSGGQQQRVALARALAPRPELVLLDEPFSNLDAELRERLSHEIRAILKQQGMTAILVTHDQNEAFAMADEIGLMADGTIQQWDTPYDLYHRPANRFVADFIGQGAFLPGTVADGGRIDVELGRLSPRLPLATGRGCPVQVLLRANDIVYDERSALRAEVVHRAFRGAEFLYTLRLPSGAEAQLLVPWHHHHALGETIGIRLGVDHAVAFADDRRAPGAAR